MVKKTRLAPQKGFVRLRVAGFYPVFGSPGSPLQPAAGDPLRSASGDLAVPGTPRFGVVPEPGTELVPM